MNVKLKVFGLVFILIILACMYLNMNMGVLIHQRVLNANIPLLFNHSLAQSYKDSILDEEKTLGFKRISLYVDDNYQLDEKELKILQNEVNDIIYEKPDQDFENLNKNKRIYYLRLFGTNTKHTSIAKKCLETIDKRANHLKSEVLTVKLEVIYPNTWNKYKEGFWGYSEYITKGVLGIKTNKNSYGIHIENNIKSIEDGKFLTYDECLKHESWNTSDKEQIILTFDLSDNGFRYGLDGLNDIEQNINKKTITNEQDYFRKKLSLEKIDSIKNILLEQEIYKNDF